MKMMKRQLLALAALLVATSTARAGDWTITDLGLLPAPYDTGSSGNAINEAGDVVGESGNRPALFAGGTVTDLGSTGLPYSLAMDINNLGQIVIRSYDDGSPSAERSFLYSDGVLTDLGSLGGGVTRANAINDSGVIVGRSTIPSGESRAFRYENGAMQEIPGFHATDINGQGDIIGFLNLNDSFLNRDGVVHTLAGGAAFAINDNGLIAGTTLGNTFEDIKAAYYSDGSWHQIGTLGGITSEAWGINNRDQLVGFADVNDHITSSHAFLYSDGVMHRLESLIDPAAGWSELWLALDVNDRGQVTGIGIKDGQTRAFLMTPTMSQFELEMTYSLAGDGEGSTVPGEVSARFVLEGIAGMPGTFRAEDVVAAYVQLGDGVWTAADLDELVMKLGPGGVNDIQTLQYAGTLVTADGLELTLANDAFALTLDGYDPATGETFGGYYPDATHSLAVVPEPSTFVLAGLALVAVVLVRRRRRRAG